MRRVALAALLLYLGVAVPAMAPAPMTMRCSWYGEFHAGKPMANRRRFDRWALTCASRTLPLGIWLWLRSPVTLRWVPVQVTDRGPYHTGRSGRYDRDLDLSEAAARALRLEDAGVFVLEVRVAEVAP